MSDAAAGIRALTEAASDTRCDKYRDLLETWTEWWNNIGRYHFTHYITPPLTETSAALACGACHNSDLDWPDNEDQRCAVCGRRGRALPPGARA